VRDESTVSADPVRLGDVAAIEGDDGRLASVVVGKAPAAAETRVLDGQMILAAIRRETGDVDGLRYTIPAAVRVRRATQEVSEATLRQMVELFVADTLGTSADDAVVRSVETPGPVRIPAGTYTARVIPPASGTLLGRVRFQVELSVDQRPVRTVGVTADIGLFGPVVLARRPVARGEVLSDVDVSVERRDLSQLPRGVVGEPGDAVGKVARAALTPSAPVRREQLEAAMVVRRGDVVLLVAERGGLRITAAGEVRQDAAAGETVRVVNRASQKTLVGRVVDASTVAVEF
jgi:flagella basal body P-ring formation protein FlgA